MKVPKSNKTITHEVEKLMIENKIKLVKYRISNLSDKHNYLMSISVGSMATEIVETKQKKLFELLDKLNKLILTKKP